MSTSSSVRGLADFFQQKVDASFASRGLPASTSGLSLHSLSSRDCEKPENNPPPADAPELSDCSFNESFNDTNSSSEDKKAASTPTKVEIEELETVTESSPIQTQIPQKAPGSTPTNRGRTAPPPKVPRMSTGDMTDNHRMFFNYSVELEQGEVSAMREGNKLYL